MLSNVAKAHYRQCLVPSTSATDTTYQNTTTSPAFIDSYSYNLRNTSTSDVRRLEHVKEFRPAHFYPSNYQNEALNPLSSDESDDNEGNAQQVCH